MTPERTVCLKADVATEEQSQHLLFLAESVKDELSNLEFVEKRKLFDRESVYIFIPRQYSHLTARSHYLHIYAHYEYDHDGKQRRRQRIIPLSKDLNQVAVEHLHRLKSTSKPVASVRARRRFPCEDVAALETEAEEEDHLFENVIEDIVPSSSFDVPLAPFPASKKRKMDDSSSSSSFSAEHENDENIILHPSSSSFDIPLAPFPASKKRKMDDDSSSPSSAEHENDESILLHPPFSSKDPLGLMTSISRKRKMDDDEASSFSPKRPCFETIPEPDDIPTRPSNRLRTYPDHQDPGV